MTDEGRLLCPRVGCGKYHKPASRQEIECVRKIGVIMASIRDDPLICFRCADYEHHFNRKCGRCEVAGCWCMGADT